LFPVLPVVLFPAHSCDHRCKKLKPASFCH
jgi:hypothetical protein